MLAGFHSPPMKILLASTLVLGAFIFSGCGDKEEGKAGKARYALVAPSVSNFWEICKKGGEDAAKELGVESELITPSSITDQKAKLEDLLSKGIDGISMAVADPENQTGFINEVAGRVPLITFDTDAPDSARKVFIGIDNYEAGWLAGDLVKEAAPEGGEVVIFVGNISQLNSRQRRQGLIDNLVGREKDSSRYDAPGQVVTGEKYTVLDTLLDGVDAPKAKANTADALTKYENLAVMVGLFDYNAPQIVEELKQANKVGQVKVVSFDEQSATLAAIKEGIIYGTVVQNPYEYGYQSIKVLHALKNGDTSMIPESGVIEIPARIIRKDNVEEFEKDLNAKLGK